MRNYYLFILFLCTFCIALLITGFTVAGDPFTQKAIQEDNQRLSDFEQIQSTIELYALQNNKLPHSLTDLKSINSNLSMKDPDTHKVYIYQVINKTTYKLCATFALDAKDEKKQNLSDISLTAIHKKGFDCISYTVKFDTNVTPTSPSYPPPTFKRITEFHDSHFSQPNDMAELSYKIWVTQKATNSVTIYNITPSADLSFGKTISLSGSPSGISPAIGAMWITVGNTIQVYNPDGNYVKTITDPSLHNPTHLALSLDKNMYIINDDNTISVFDCREGTYSRTFNVGNTFQAEHLSHILPISIYHSYNGTSTTTFWVSDDKTSKILRTADGQQVNPLQNSETENPTAMSEFDDNRGRFVFILNTNSNTIEVYDYDKNVPSPRNYTDSILSSPQALIWFGTRLYVLNSGKNNIVEYNIL